MKIVIRESFAKPEHVIENVQEVTLRKTRYAVIICIKLLDSAYLEYDMVNVKTIKV